MILHYGIEDAAIAINPDGVVEVVDRFFSAGLLPFTPDRLRVVEHVAQPEDEPRPPFRMQFLKGLLEFAPRSARNLVYNQDVRREPAQRCRDGSRAEAKQFLQGHVPAASPVLSVFFLGQRGECQAIGSGRKPKSANFPAAGDEQNQGLVS